MRSPSARCLKSIRAHPALEDRKLVERAKGLLMSALNLSEQDAFRRLQTTARERNLRLADVARRIVEQQSLLEPNPESPVQ
jgi:two-component system, response regulator PdtaR